MAKNNTSKLIALAMQQIHDETASQLSALKTDQRDLADLQNALQAKQANDEARYTQLQTLLVEHVETTLAEARRWQRTQTDELLSWISDRRRELNLRIEQLENDNATASPEPADKPIEPTDQKSPEPDETAPPTEVSPEPEPDAGDEATVSNVRHLKQASAT
jgi:septal ring factor EnvC (AmiA/AmiB activator)